MQGVVCWWLYLSQFKMRFVVFSLNWATFSVTEAVDSFSFVLMLSPSEAGTQKLLNYKRIRQFVGTDKLRGNYPNFQFT